MPVFEIQRSIKAHADVIWKVITDHQSFTEISPDITRIETVSGEKLGIVNRIVHKSGKVWQEKCIDWQELSSYTMQVISGDYPLPVTKMQRTFSMEEGPNNVLLKLKYKYSPRYGPFGGLLNKLQVLPILKLFSHRSMDNLVGKIYDVEWGFHVTAATILKGKGSELIAISTELKVMEAINLLTSNKIVIVMVLDAAANGVGVVYRRDIVSELDGFGRDDPVLTVTEARTNDGITCHPDDNLDKLMKCMTDRRIRHLAVVDGDQVKGIISIGDIVKTRMDELETDSAMLHSYINDRRWRELALQIGKQGATEEFENPAEPI